MIDGKSTKKILRMILIYCLGLFILALGISFSVKSDLGVSPISSIAYVVSQILSLDLGLCTTAVMLLFIFIQFLILRRDFKVKHLLQIVCSSLFGLFVSVASWITAPIQVVEFYPLRLVFCGISILLIAIGVFFYLAPNLISLPTEGVMQAISLKYKIPFHRIKIMFDCTVVACAALLSVIFMHELVGVREGTVLAAIFVGICMKFIKKIAQEPLQCFLDGTEFSTK